MFFKLFVYLYLFTQLSLANHISFAQYDIFRFNHENIMSRLISSIKDDYVKNKYKSPNDYNINFY